MICRNCHKEIPESTRFCPFCGAPVQPMAPAAPVFQERPEAGHQQPPQNACPQQPVVPPQAPYIPQQGPYESQQAGQAPQQPGYGYAPAPSAAPQFAPGGFPKQPSKKKTRWIVLGSVGGFLVVAGIALACFLEWYNAPLQVYNRAMEEADYETAGLQLELLEERDRFQATNRLILLAEDTYRDYNRGEITYEEVEALIKTLYSYCPEDGLEELLNDLKRLRNSKTSFEKGAAAEAAGEYREAISYYEQVIQEDFGYEKALEKTGTLRESYKNEILQQAGKLADEEKYEEACELLLESKELLGGDLEINSLWNEYRRKAREKEQDALGFAPSGKYKSIEALIQSESIQSSIDGMKASMGSIGEDVSISAQGNKLIYTFVIKDLNGVDEELLGSVLNKALDEMDDTFEAIADSLKLAVEVEDPIVVVQYITANGKVLSSREFSAS